MLQSLCVTLPLGGCLLTGGKPEPGLDIPATYSAGPRNPAAAEAAVPPLDWWRAFRSRELTALIEEASAANLDIAVAVAQIVQADAQARIVGAALLPTVDLNGNAVRNQLSKTTGSSSVVNVSPSGASVAIIQNNLQAVLSASYEIDFWGKNRAALRAAEESAVASRYNREVVGLTTVASVANAYFLVLAAQDRLRIARQNVASADRILNLIRQQFSAGTASDLNVAQQESLVDTQRATIPPLEQALQQNKAVLALLLARPYERVTIRGGGMGTLAIPRVTPGLPSELIAQRPDIRLAEAQLASANANVENARAQFLPSIKLTGDAGYESAFLKLLLRPESVIYTVAASLTQPIFHGGALLGNLDLQKGVQDQLLQNYRKAVISGFTDVDKALIAVRETALAEQLQRKVVASSRRAFELSDQQLRAGTVNLIALLQVQQTLFQAEDALAQARLARLQAIVSLYQALGGGWLPKPVEAANAR
ncbi:MAG TPA: efflux transporter outer membrane subunit [Pseudolabrys sp.]|nr:efflux transporter outer membrane subunit [Pseudolabrys sp.]